MFCRQTKCNECGAYIDKINPVTYYLTWFKPDTKYYCEKCKKPYEEVYEDLGGTPKIYKKVRVDGQGIPIGFKKIT